MKRKVFLAAITLVIILLGVNFGLPILFKSKIEGLIKDKLPNQVSLTYKSLSLGIFRGNISIQEPHLIVKDSNNSRITSEITLDAIEFVGLHYLDIINDQEINVESLLFIHPEGYYEPTKILSKPKKTGKKDKPLESIYIDDFEIVDASFKILDTITDSLKLRIPKLNLKAKGIEYHLKTDLLPSAFVFKDYNIELDSLFLRATKYEDLSIAKIHGNLKETQISEFKFVTRLSKKDYSKALVQERDHYNLKVSNIRLTDIALPLHRDSTLYHLKEITINEPNLNVFRDKLVPDEHSVKPMLSAAIRNIPIKLLSDSLFISNGYVNYQERVHAYNEGGNLFFDQANLSFSNFGNGSDLKSNINIKANFMGHAPINAVWSFKALDGQDKFEFKGHAEDVVLHKFNTFTLPNLRTSLKGNIHKLYFTIYGDGYNSHTDLRAYYNDVKITVMNKSNHRNKFFSSVANLIVSSDSKSKKHEYKESEAKTKRDLEKSNFNYLFASLKNGLVKVFL